MAPSRRTGCVVAESARIGLFLLLFLPIAAFAHTTETLKLRGRVQTLHLSGPPGGHPVVVSSGDGGWIHLAPQVATMLAARGFFVVGFDSKAYLESFTTGASTLTTTNVPADYRELVRFAGTRSRGKPLSAGEAARIMAAARQPKRLWMVEAADHRFSDRQTEMAARLAEAIDWVRKNEPR